MGKMKARPYIGPNVIAPLARHPGWRERLVAILTHDDDALQRSLATIDDEQAWELAVEQERLRARRRDARNARRRRARARGHPY